MKIDKLITRIQLLPIEWVNSSNSDEEIYNLFVSKKDQSYDSNCLYICTNSTLPKTFLKENLNFIYVSDSSVLPDFNHLPNSNIIHIKTKLSTEKIRLTISDILAKDNIMTSHMYRLIQVLHSNKGIHALIDEAYSVLQNPILLVDAGYKILASRQANVEKRPDLEEQSNQGYMNEQNIIAMKKARLYEKARESKYPYYSKQSSEHDAWITALVFVHGIESAHIAVMETNRKFTEEDFELIDFLCRLVSLELQKTDFYKTNASLKHSFFLSELLDNHMRDINTINQRIKSLNWKVTDFMYIMTITEQQADFFDRKAQLISKQLNQLLPHSRWVIYEGKIVFLLCLSDQSKTLFEENSSLQEFLKINDLNASISRCFSSFLDIRKYYEESLTAYDFGLKLSPNSQIFMYEDFICQHIGKILSKTYDLEDFYHTGIMQIKKYDKEHKTNLLETLKEYLKYPDNPSAASKNLFIHKNTLFYRMSKIKELFPIDLSDGEDRLKMHLTLKFMELE